jgi:hypothetical protein
MNFYDILKFYRQSYIKQPHNRCDYCVLDLYGTMYHCKYSKKVIEKKHYNITKYLYSKNITSIRHYLSDGKFVFILLDKDEKELTIEENTKYKFL